ncbi:hypothetical protein SPHV1_2270158 [Novosphingobium sp. KN65.2]|nr:hypothetical protein SPHV1_2270158 [Novosphingobium sp. KN65.2]
MNFYVVLLCNMPELSSLDVSQSLEILHA